MTRLLRHLPLTRIRITFARAIQRILTMFISLRPRVVSRKGIRYELDLNEGIDFSVFLVGGFQRHLTSALSLSENAVVIDVGANIGSVTLPAARIAHRGEVHAFEPSDYAYRKLQRNVELNPELAPRIFTNKAFLSDCSAKEHDSEVYARWPLTRRGEALHVLHGGSKEKATRTQTLTLDEYVQDRRLPRVDLVKIDTDGHELEVLAGSKQVIKRYRPKVVFEVGGYLLDERGHRIEEFLQYFQSLDYYLQDLKSGVEVNQKSWPKIIPQNSTTDVLATPREAPRPRASERGLQLALFSGLAFLLCFQARWALSPLYGYDESCHLAWFHRLSGETFPNCYSPSHFWGVALFWMPNNLLIKPLAFLSGYSFTDWALPITGFSSYLHWCFSLFLLDGIIKRFSRQGNEAENKCPTPAWTLSLLLCVPIMPYAFQFNFMSQAAECLITILLFYFAQRKILSWTIFFAGWLVLTRLNDIFVVLVVFAILLENLPDISARTARLLWTGSAIVASMALVIFYRIAFITGYNHFFLSDVVNGVRLNALQKALFNPDYGLVWHDPLWLFLFGTLSLRLRKLDWTGKAVWTWMLGLFLLQISVSGFYGSTESRYLIGSYVAAIFVMLKELRKMPVRWQMIFRNLVIICAIWRSYYFMSMHSSNIVYFNLMTGDKLNGLSPLIALGLLTFPWQLIKTAAALSPIGFIVLSLGAIKLPMFAAYKHYQKDALTGPALWTLVVCTFVITIVLVSLLKRLIGHRSHDRNFGLDCA